MTEHFPACHKRTHLVRHHECGPQGNMKLQLLLDCLQDIAAEHAEQLKCGMEDLMVSKRIWVLSRLRIRILRFPALKDELEMLTYPAGHDRLSAFRQYNISCGGEELVQGSSAWVMLDGTTYRPIPMDKAFTAPLPANEEKTRYFEKFEKFPPFEEGVNCSFRVGAGDIDLNLHLNNAVYARWISDVLGEKYNSMSVKVREIQLNYLASGKFGDEIFLRARTESDGRFLISGEKSDGTAIFQAGGLAEC